MAALIRDRIQSMCGAGIDRAVLRAMEWAWFTGPNAGSMKEDGTRSLSLYTDRARQDPRAFFREPAPAAIEVVSSRSIPSGKIVELSWRSGYATWDRAYQEEYDRYAENQIACAECILHDELGHPTIICLHPWMAGGFRLQRRMFLRRYLYGLGFNVALFALPFHGERTPKEAWFSGQLFPGRCPKRTNEGFGQAVWDVRALLGHFLQRDAAPVGVIGMSIGGYTSALLACFEPRLAFSVPIIPVVDLAGLMWLHGSNRPERFFAETGGRTLEEMREIYAVHSPLRHRPILPRDRRMVIAGASDRILGRDHVLTLWEHWERPEIHWWPGGHVIHFGRERSFQVLGEFLRRASARGARAERALDGPGASARA